MSKGYCHRSKPAEDSFSKLCLSSLASFLDYKSSNGALAYKRKHSSSPEQFAVLPYPWTTLSGRIPWHASANTKIPLIFYLLRNSVDLAPNSHLGSDALIFRMSDVVTNGFRLFLLCVMYILCVCCH